MRHSEAGKGDIQRPTDHKAFGNGYDAIDWSKKPELVSIKDMPQSFQDAIKKGLEDGTLIPE